VQYLHARRNFELLCGLKGSIADLLEISASFWSSTDLRTWPRSTVFDLIAELVRFQTYLWLATDQSSLCDSQVGQHHQHHLSCLQHSR
jgi:hypothetical protein